MGATLVHIGYIRVLVVYLVLPEHRTRRKKGAACISKKRTYRV